MIVKFTYFLRFDFFFYTQDNTMFQNNTNFRQGCKFMIFLFKMSDAKEGKIERVLNNFQL